MRIIVSAMVALGCCGLVGCASLSPPDRDNLADIAPVLAVQKLPVSLAPYGPDTVVIDPREHTLYYIDHDGATYYAYSVGVGRAGFEWSGEAYVAAKKDWPEWRPPKEMIAREARRGHFLPEVMAGGPRNPLGAHALYLHSGGRDTYYRIHGTNDRKSIGRSESSGCIRMLNEDVLDLSARVRIGTRVVVL